MAWVVTAIAGATGLSVGTVAVVGGTLGAAAIGASASGRAVDAAAKGQADALAATSGAVSEAKLDINRLFGKAADTRTDAFGRTLDLLSGAPAKQIAPFQAGSLAAQETTAAGLPQVQRAILGLPTDLSQIRPRSIEGDFNVDISQFRPVPALPAPAAASPTAQLTPAQITAQNRFIGGGGGGVTNIGRNRRIN